VHTSALVPNNRQWLHTRIAERLEQMFAAGLLEETRRILLDLDRSLPACRAVGYAQALAFLDGRVGADWQSQALYATRQFAKRQLTWLRSLPVDQILPAGHDSSG
jgi:tRNA dimethylallyltransferase